MCGLTGYWHFNQRLETMSLTAVGQAMAARLQHRGPNSSGVWVDEAAHFVLGHQRLAIVDLTSAGEQPMISPSGHWVIAYNGEIYNAPQLRATLKATGIIFQGTSDTEVILKSCEQWGVERAVKKFIGMFAFAVWEKNQRRLYLVRDRLGIKPLYWGFNQDILFFGSELKSFFAHPQWQAHIDREALVSYFRFGYIPTPLSIYKNIFKLKPGHLIVIDEKRNIKESSYWQLSEIIASVKKSPQKSTAEENIIQLDTLLRDAVKCRMLADVPLGAFLSGGIDSSLVVALMQLQSEKSIKTFTLGFEAAAYNEALQARAVAKYLGTDHHELTVNAMEAQAVIPDLMTWYDEPFADSSQIPTYLVSKLAREHVTVSLSGDGGDEIFAGYSRYLVTHLFWSRFGALPPSIKNLLTKSIHALRPDQWNHLVKYIPSRIRPNNFSEKIDKFSTLLRSTQETCYLPLMSVWPNAELLVKAGKENFQWDVPAEMSNFIERMQYIDTLTYLPDDILTKIDRASMAVSLEARVPLLDHRVLEFAWALPMSMKVRGKQGKWILRQILKQYLPQKLYERPKMGFGVPLEQWLRGPLRAWAEDLLDKNQLESQGLLNAELIHEYWETHLSGRRNFRYALWSVLMFQSWYRKWM